MSMLVPVGGSGAPRPTTAAEPLSGDWRHRAVCRDVDPEWFFPTAEKGPVHDAEVERAKGVCAQCPVRAQCLDDALARLPYGIAGGLTEGERRGLKRQRAVAVAGSAGVGAARPAASSLAPARARAWSA